MVRNFLTAFAHQNFLKIQHKMNKSEKKGTLFLQMKKVASDTWTLN